ncbi:hypothetical protein CPB83DRAFT_861265 [Crepidotus variabilis]|uniref:Uncharacterized protein n=1 Tax=Crepidotus variabilis TaxID=179855 RepID=A0A9P6E8U5_9AGAR|nr:hypothetical protein CPB83DRAFT_861265 [Crepidotus variabilis]
MSRCISRYSVTSLCDHIGLHRIHVWRTVQVPASCQHHNHGRTAGSSLSVVEPW